MQNMNFGDKLQILRKDLNITQKEFSKHLKIPQPTLSAYEKNRNSPTMEVLMNITKTCNVSLGWLCSLSSTKHSISTLGDIAKEKTRNNYNLPLTQKSSLSYLVRNA